MIVDSCCKGNHMAGKLFHRCAMAVALLVFMAPAQAAPPVPRPKPPIKAPAPAVAPTSTPQAASERAGPTLLTAADAALYRQAFNRVTSGEWPQAVAVASKAHEKLPGKVILWIWLSARNSGASFDEITSFMDANPDWPRQQTLAVRADEAITDTTPVEVQKAWFARNPPSSATGRMRHGEVLLATGATEEGAKQIRAAYIDPDLSEDDESHLLAKSGRLIRAEDHRARLDALLWEGDAQAARRMISRVDGDWAALARARMALRQSTRDVDAALGRVPPSLTRNPGLLYERARWLRQKDRDVDAEKLLLSLTPDAIAAQPDKWWAERRIEARKRLKDGAVTEAYQLARNHGLTEGTGFVEAEFLAGWIALRFLDDPGMAYGHFANLHQAAKFAVTQARGAYWAGRAAKAMGDGDKARRWFANAGQYGTTFYGQLAAHEVGDEAALRLPKDPVPTSADRAAFAQNELVRAARMLGQLGEDDRLRPFIAQLNGRAMKPVERQLAADLAAELDRDDLAIATAKDSDRAGVPLIARGWPLRKVPKGPPEPALVLGLTRQESAFEDHAVSPVGAQGLMQLMPATAKHIAKKIKVPFDKNRLVKDPYYNMMLGSAFLDDLVGNYDGSYVMALAAYNAGPGRVSQWVREYGDPRAGDLDMIDWIESIPFEETRNYVQRVMENVQVYRQRLAADKVVPLRLAEDLQRATKPHQETAQRAPAGGPPAAKAPDAVQPPAAAPPATPAPAPAPAPPAPAVAPPAIPQSPG